VTVRNNVVDGSDEDGIDIDLEQDATIPEGSLGVEVTIASNEVSNTLGEGIDVWIDDDSDENVLTIRSNVISHGEKDGVDVDIRDGSENNEVTIASNRMIDSKSDGVHINLFNAGSTGNGNVLTVESNRMTDSVVNNGVYIDVSGNSDDNEFVINGNTIREPGGDGIQALFRDTTDNNLLQIGDNSIIDPFDDGIDIEGSAVATTRLSSEFNGADRNNSVTDPGGDDAEFTTGDLFTGQLLVNDNPVPTASPVP
jgi:hypothetical protein